MRKFISTILAIILALPAAFILPTEALAVNTQIRQEVNILDSYLTAASGNYATSSEIVAITDNSYSNPLYYLEVVASTSAATAAQVYLVNATSSATTTPAAVVINGTSATRYRSAAFLPSASTTVEYKLVIGKEAVGKSVVSARIIVLQNAGTLSNTETQIEIGSTVTASSSITTGPANSPKYWYYDATKWDGSPTFYAEATYSVTSVASSTTYFVSATTTATYFEYIGSKGVGLVVAEAWGAGGGGDGVSSANTIGGGGGAGGAYARSTTTVAALSKNYIGVGAGGAEGVDVVPAGSSTVTTAAGVFVRAAGGGGATGAPGGATTTSANSIGGVINQGGGGGAGNTDVDTGGGGGGAGGPHGAGIQGVSAQPLGIAGAGSAGDNSLGGAGGAAGNGGDDTCDTENGGPGVNNTNGGGGGGGGDGDVSSTCVGGPGGRPGGGGGGSDEGTGSATAEVGGPGQVKITEWIGTVGIALEESDGTGDGFVGWTNKIQILSVGKTSTTSERVRSASFTPTSGRNYRIVASTTNSTASYDIYNAKVVVVQGGSNTQSNYVGGADANIVGGTAGAAQFGQAQAQSFQTPVGGNLNSIVVRLKKNGSPVDTLNFDIVSSLGGSSLSNATLDGSTLTTSYASTTITFISPASITANTTYYFQITRSPDVFDSANSYRVEKTISSTNPYTNGATWKRDNNSWVEDTNFDLLFEVNVTATNPTLLQPQYLLANTKLAAGTSLQNYLTSWDSTEWSTTNAYVHQIEASNGNTSVTELDTAAGVQVAGSPVSSPDNRATSTITCMPSNGNLDVKITTDNGNVFASRILVDVGGVAATCPVSGAAAIATPRWILYLGKWIQTLGTLILK